MPVNHSERHQRKAGSHDRTEKRKSSTGLIRSANTLRCAHVLILVLPDVRHGMCFIGRHFTGLMPDSFRLATIRDLGVLNSVSAAASSCHQHTFYVLLSMNSVIEKLSGAP